MKKFKMSNCNTTITPMETIIKSKKKRKNELVNATLYKETIGSLRYLCNTKHIFVKMLTW